MNIRSPCNMVEMTSFVNSDPRRHLDKMGAYNDFSELEKESMRAEESGEY